MKNKNDRLKGIIAAAIFLLLLFVLSLFLGFHYPVPPIPDVGVEIEMGGSGSSGGIEGQEVIPEPTPVTQPSPSSATKTFVTDDRPENPYNPPVVTPATKPVEAPEKVQPEQPKKSVNPDAMFPKKGTSGQPGTGSGSGTGSGTGTGKSSGDGTGTGTGPGSGPSFSLVGRTAKELPKPAYYSNNQGKVVIDVQVDQMGYVQNAQYNSKLSTTSDLQLRTAAISAAKKSRFSVKENAPVIQQGTITYTFIKLN